MRPITYQSLRLKAQFTNSSWVVSRTAPEFLSICANVAVRYLQVIIREKKFSRWRNMKFGPQPVKRSVWFRRRPSLRTKSRLRHGYALAGKVEGPYDGSTTT